MSKLNLVFGIHIHQPLDTIDDINESAYKKAYLPFIETLEKHPRIRFVFHAGGSLFEWINEKHPEFIEKLKKMAAKRQVEILSGGHFEPILAMIPDDDKLGQLKLSIDFIKSTIGVVPRGAYLAENVWKPQLAKILSLANIDYVPLNDDHFASLGILPEDLNGYYLTEDEGYKLKIFPANSLILDSIPARSPEEIINALKSIAAKANERTMTLIDDGNKYGLLNDSNKLFYKDGYLEKLLKLIEENSSWLITTTFADQIDNYPSSGKVYLPEASASKYLKSQNIGFYKNFLVESIEANNLFSKMSLVSGKLDSISQGNVLDLGDPNRKKMLKQAELELYKGQQKAFEEIHIDTYRDMLYKHLINAERIIDKLRYPDKFLELTITDHNKDGFDEVLVSSDQLNLYFSPEAGGSIFELDFKPKSFNLTNTIAANSLVDHFLAENISIEKFAKREYKEESDFYCKPYKLFINRSQNDLKLTLWRSGELGAGGANTKIKLSKALEIFAGQSIISINYEIENQDEKEAVLWFGTEFSFSMLASESKNKYYFIDEKRKLEDRSLFSKGEMMQFSTIKVVDGYRGISVSLNSHKIGNIWRFPIESIVKTDSGLERKYQQSVLFPNWKFKLNPGEIWKNKIVLSIEG